MNTPSFHTWAFGTRRGSPFAHPVGPRGRLAGWVMLLTNDQRDALDLLGVRPGDHVLEIGYGPGGFLRHLRATPAERICGVDPSPDMRDLAARRLRGEVRRGRVDLRLGTSDDTGFPEGTFHRVVTINTVAIWPELEPGLGEIHRVTRPGGRVLIAWHGRTARSPIARGLALPEDRLERLEDAMRERFTSVRRVELRSLTAFTGER